MKAHTLIYTYFRWRVIDNENDQIGSCDAKPTSHCQSDVETKVLDAANITNGHVSELENKNLIKSVRKQKQTAVIIKSSEEETSTSSNSKENYKTQVKIQRNVKTKAVASSANTNKTGTVLKKLKTDSHMTDSPKCGSDNDKAGNDCNEKILMLQNCSKIALEEDEDISDDAIFLRHERALTEERRKFQTYLKFPWSTRSRANRRIDSRAESSGANTPDPSSPAPQTPSVGGGDLEVSSNQ